MLSSVIIGNQEWASENLNVSTFRNGDVIPEVQTEDAWYKAGNEGKPAWCYYDNDPRNGTKYGKLYNWYTANDPRGLAPIGWHIPSAAEWNKLRDYLGGIGTAGNKMKSKEGWNENGSNESEILSRINRFFMKKDNGNGSNESGFSGLPGGNRYINGTFSLVGARGYWWSSTQQYSGYLTVDSINSKYVNTCELKYGADFVVSQGLHKYNGFSVRCVRVLRCCFHDGGL